MYKIDDATLRVAFKEHFGIEPIDVISCGGRFEIIGNHTDHNHGVCMTGTCNLNIEAAVSLRSDKEVHVVSKGYDREMIIDLDHLELEPMEKGSSQAIIKGVLNYLHLHNYRLGGFNAYVDSEIPAGSGLSSSAAYETLMGRIVNRLFNKDEINKLMIAKAGYYAENEYFGKKSGLLDQIGVSYGGINIIDFKDIDNPMIANVNFPFSDVAFVLINTGGSHAGLSGQYAAIPESMYTIANHFGKRFLRDVPEVMFREELAEEEREGHQHFDRIDKNRAIHFYEENKRVVDVLKALKTKDKELFFKSINASSKSSENNLLNTMLPGEYKGSPQEAIDYANALIDKGAVKVNGGGFMGTVIAFINRDELDGFLKRMRARYGEEMVFELELRNE